ncbi:MAG: septum formation protein Maf [Bacilli bacterium]|nr:septum formation protein Maf [Bacilli bacterium]
MFILASGSPRRKELLHKIVDDFEVVVPDIDESHHPLDPKDLPKELSKEKAYAIYRRFPNDEILACDTIVILDHEVLGKPKSPQNAIEMLEKESGRRQIVLSGYTYIGKGKEISRTVATEVYFNKLSLEQIKDYVTRFAPFDKAGSYGIQDDFPLIEKIVGSYDNVMGLPTEDIKAHIL